MRAPNLGAQSMQLFKKPMLSHQFFVIKRFRCFAGSLRHKNTYQLLRPICRAPAGA